MIDLRSDTVTKPTAAMRDVMARAEVGDDMSGEDPTVNRLEARCAELFGREAAVYTCSGTQSNQMAVWSHCQRGDELLIESTGHIANYEGGAPAILSGVTTRPIVGKHGLLTVANLEGHIKPDNQHFCVTRLLCVENTTNLGGGAYYPLSQLKEVCDWAHANGLRVHMDGARVFNAIVAGGYSPCDVGQLVDSISVCFSKGLGCPMGSILIGGKELIARARRARKVLGGALRQAGIVAAAAEYALDHHVERLNEDHANAQVLVQALRGIPGLSLTMPEVQSNLVFFDLEPAWGTAAQFSALLKTKGVLINPTGGPQRLRACTHLDVTREDMHETARILAECVKLSPSANAGEVGAYTSSLAK